jgi:hypothetical protein
MTRSSIESAIYVFLVALILTFCYTVYRVIAMIWL